jgi:hypothetical protein
MLAQDRHEPKPELIPLLGLGSCEPSRVMQTTASGRKFLFGLKHFIFGNIHVVKRQSQTFRLGREAVRSGLKLQRRLTRQQRLAQST